MGKPHVLALPYPAQGHVIPLMDVAQCLANNGIKVTFVNSEFNHERVIKAHSHSGSINKLITLVSMPDGLESWEDRNDLGKFAEKFLKVMPGNLEALIEKTNATESDEITCVITDYWLARAIEVAEKFGIKRAAFLPSSVAMAAFSISSQKLLDDGIVDCNGTPLKKQVIQLSPGMPGINTTNLAWLNLGDLDTQKLLFQSIIENCNCAKMAELLICNSSHELEPEALAYVPNCLPIGPLLASNRFGKSAGYFWPEDSTCLDWLAEQPPCSVIYVAFGSITVFDQTQFQELALGLELTNRPFLWVVRQDITEDTIKAYPIGFEERIKNRGKIVGWAPQQKVLSHPSVSCFLSHCGWNSTIEGVCNGVPFLCWPYFTDQFFNESYICDLWEIGLGLNKDETGVIRGEEIKNKVEQLLSDARPKKRALELQEKTLNSVKEGGCSDKNYRDFVDWIRKN